MKGSTLVHWQEGLFLQPHHLQTMQQGIADRIADRQALVCSHPYGVVASEISVDAIHNRRLEFERLHVILRSGRHIRIPEDAQLPPLDLGPLMEGGPDSFLVSLGLPHWSSDRGNVVEAGKIADGVYRVEEREVPDDSSGLNPQPLQLRVPNVRLVINDDGRTACETLPILRIRRGVGDQIGRPVIDRTFVPPSYVVEGSVDLRRMLQSIADQVEASRREVVNQLVQEEFSGENMRLTQLVPVLKLRTLNLFSARLSSFIHASGIAPFQWYLALRELLGELVALQPREDSVTDCSDYRHEDLGPVFTDLCNRVRAQLVNVRKQSVLKVQFAERDGVLLAQLTDEHISRPNAYFLGIQTNGDAKALAELVEHPDKFKLMAKRHVLRAVRGLCLVEERHPAPELPRQAGLYYFRVDRAHEQSITAWAHVISDPEKAIAVKRPANAFPDASYTLYMTIAD